MASFETWGSYFYPPPDDQTLRNVEGIRDRWELREWEYQVTADRQRELLADPSLVAHSFDAAHVRAIHRHLFQDVYEWAGEYRTQNIGREGDYMGFADAANGEIGLYLELVHAEVVDTRWAVLDRGQFAEDAARVFVYLNQAHPFREGNGRSSKVFMHHVAARSGFELDFHRVDPTAWNIMSGLSRPQPGRVWLEPAAIAPAFLHAARERAAAPPCEQHGGLTAVRSASYPHPAAQATRDGGGAGQDRPRGEIPRSGQEKGRGLGNGVER